MTESKDKAYLAIWTALSKGVNRTSDVVFAEVLDDIRRDDLFSDDTLTLIQSTVESGLNKMQLIFLKNRFKNRDEKKIVDTCHYISLCATEVPSISLSVMGNIIRACEAGVAGDIASSLDERVGVAHALIALKEFSDRDVFLMKNEQVLEEYPDVVRLFVENNRLVLTMYDFIRERGIHLDSSHDIELLRDFTQSVAPALSSGAL